MRVARRSREGKKLRAGRSASPKAGGGRLITAFQQKYKTAWWLSEPRGHSSWFSALFGGGGGGCAWRV